MAAGDFLFGRGALKKAAATAMGTAQETDEEKKKRLAAQAGSQPANLPIAQTAEDVARTKLMQEAVKKRQQGKAKVY